MREPSKHCEAPSFIDCRRFHDVDRVFASAMEDNVFPGASLIVARPNHILFRNTWGQTRIGGSDVTDATLFDLASLTKPLVTSTICMWAISQGHFTLDDPLGMFFPHGIVPADKRSITIRNLLSHSSGLPAYEPFFESLIMVPAPLRRASILCRILSTPLVSSPGTACRYSDLGFILLGLVLETVMEMPLDRIAFEFVFSPLGIQELLFHRIDMHSDPTIVPGGTAKSLSFEPLPSLFRAYGEESIQQDASSTSIVRTLACHPVRSNLAFGEKSSFAFELERSLDCAATELCPWRRRLIQCEVHDENAYTLGGVAGHAGLFGTAQGVYLLLSFLWRTYKGANNNKHLSSDVVRTFWSRENGLPSSTWALGFDTPSRERSSAGVHFSPHSVGHLGFTGTSFWIDLDQEIMIILLTNRVHPTRANEKIKAFRPAIHNLLMEVYNAA